jgi:signal peptidase
MDRDTITVGRLPVLRPLALSATTIPEPAIPSKLMRLPRTAGRVALNVVFVAMMACVAIMLVPAALGFQRYVILTGSMTGTYDRGSIVYDRPVPVSDLKVGDPITYSPPPGFTHQIRVTHRIWSIHVGSDGERIFKTKGDANLHPDVWQFTLNQPTQERVVFHVPEVGYLFLLLSLRDFRIVLVGVPAVIIGLILMLRLWREAGQEARRQELAGLGWRTLADPGSGAVLPPLDAPAADRRPARLDLRLPPPRARAVDRRSRPRIARRSCLDLSVALRAGRLATAGPAGGHADVLGTSVEHEQPGPGASIATSRLLVAYLRRPS